MIPASGNEDERLKALDAVMAGHHYSGHALIEVLHAAQKEWGYLTSGLMRHIARKLRLPPSRVLGVATFYHLFRFTSPAPHEAVVCMGTACYVQGAANLLDSARRACARNGWAVTTGRCVGSCGLAPVAVCDGAAMSRATPAALSAEMERKYDAANPGPRARG